MYRVSRYTEHATDNINDSLADRVAVALKLKKEKRQNGMSHYHANKKTQIHHNYYKIGLDTHGIYYKGNRHHAHRCTPM